MQAFETILERRTRQAKNFHIAASTGELTSYIKSCGPPPCQSSFDRYIYRQAVKSAVKASEQKQLAKDIESGKKKIVSWGGEIKFKCDQNKWKPNLLIPRVNDHIKMYTPL